MLFLFLANIKGSKEKFYIDLIITNNMAQILFCEDDKDSRESLFMDLQKGFPAHAIVASETVRDGLAGVTGIDLNPRYLDH